MDIKFALFPEIDIARYVTDLDISVSAFKTFVINVPNATMLIDMIFCINNQYLEYFNSPPRGISIPIEAYLWLKHSINYSYHLRDEELSSLEDFKIAGIDIFPSTSNQLEIIPNDSDVIKFISRIKEC